MRVLMLEGWSHVASFTKGVGARLNGVDIEFGWHSRELEGRKCILCIQKLWTYVTIFESGCWKETILCGKELEIDEFNVCHTVSLSEHDVRKLLI